MLLVFNVNNSINFFGCWAAGLAAGGAGAPTAPPCRLRLSLTAFQLFCGKLTAPRTRDPFTCLLCIHLRDSVTAIFSVVIKGKEETNNVAVSCHVGAK